MEPAFVRVSCSSRALGLLALVGLGAPLAAQSFQDQPAQIPQGSPSNVGFTENVELVDVDLDGDLDLVFANGGDVQNERNRLWINLGGAQGGTPGFFQDQTAARLPMVLDSSRDVDFVDIDRDGDQDLFISNTSAISNQSNRWWVNMGGLQGGAAGFFEDQTATRWKDLGVNNGVARSSIAPSLVLPEGFIDWSCDSSFADLDLDGQLDLVQTTYGALASGDVPSRIFLNDGSGRFEEFNPSGFQLAGTDLVDGDPALWCEGTQQRNTTDTSGLFADVAADTAAVELADIDLDLDVDVLLGEKFDDPRIMTNRLAPGGGLAFRDVSYAVFPANWAPHAGSYEQELGDIDLDGDLDIYGLNWAQGDDEDLRNRGDGTFAPPTVIVQTFTRQFEADFLDYDADGDLDVFLSSQSAPELLYENSGAAGSFALAITSGELPAVLASADGADAGDLDLDGDTDLVVATFFGEADHFFENVTQQADVTAPSFPRVEQASDRNASPQPTFVRAHVLDNAPWYSTALHPAFLEYRVNGGAFAAAAMQWCGGQLFRGAIPGELVGTIDYRVSASDDHGNTGTSAILTFIATCTGNVATYCTAKTNSLGCTPAISASGTPSVSSGAPFLLNAEQVLASKAGLFFYSIHGPGGGPLQGGHLCATPPTRRTPVQTASASGAPPCTGTFSFDMNARIASGADPTLTAGVEVWSQYWTRDSGVPSGTGFTNGLSFFICP